MITLIPRRIGGSASLDELIVQMRATTNAVTRSVLKDCIVDRIIRNELY